nr:hypothetical protein [Tanacetum cinerariifolium]
RAVPDYVSWRHHSSVITDPKHTASSYSQTDVRRLSASFVKLRDMLEGLLVLSGLSRLWKSHTHDLILRESSGNRLPFYYAPPAAPDAVIPRPTQEDLAAATPSTKVLAKAEASKKRTASTFRAAPSQVAKRTRSTTAHSLGSFSDPTCLMTTIAMISLITPIRFAATIPVGGNQSRGLVPSATEDSTSGAISRDFSLFALGPYYATYPKDGVVVGSYEVSREEWDDQYQPNLSILTKGVFKDPNAYKTVVNKFPTPGEMVTDLNDKVIASDAAFVKAKAKGKE